MKHSKYLYWNQITIESDWYFSIFASLLISTQRSRIGKIGRCNIGTRSNKWFSSVHSLYSQRQRVLNEWLRWRLQLILWGHWRADFNRNKRKRLFPSNAERFFSTVKWKQMFSLKTDAVLFVSRAETVSLRLFIKFHLIIRTGTFLLFKFTTTFSFFAKPLKFMRLWKNGNDSKKKNVQNLHYNHVEIYKNKIIFS